MIHTVCVLLCFNMCWRWLILSISLRFISLALGQSYEFPWVLLGKAHKSIGNNITTKQNTHNPVYMFTAPFTVAYTMHSRYLEKKKKTTMKIGPITFIPSILYRPYPIHSYPILQINMYITLMPCIIFYLLCVHKFYPCCCFTMIVLLACYLLSDNSSCS